MKGLRMRSIAALLFVGAMGCNSDPIRIGAVTDLSITADEASGADSATPDDEANLVDEANAAIDMEMPGSIIDMAMALPVADLAHPDLAIHQVSLTAKRYPAGSGPTAIVAGDFNGDGNPDVATSNAFDSDVTALLGNGDGSLRPPLASAVPGLPSWMASGDFNRDGLTDVVVLRSRSGDSSDNVSLLLSRNDGTFGLAASCSLSNGGVGSGSGLAVADFDRDGFLDAAVGDGNMKAIQVCLGDGSMFPNSRVFASPVLATPYMLGTADFDGDQFPDLAVGLASTDAGNGLDDFHGRGDGTFNRASVVFGGTGKHALSIGDLDGDGIPDLVDVPDQGGVALFRGNGDGTFTGLGSCGCGVVSAFALGDMDGDGRADIVIANRNDQSLHVYGGLAKSQWNQLATSSVGSLPIGIVIVDLNRDGINDVAVADNGSNDVTVLLGGH